MTRLDPNVSHDWKTICASDFNSFGLKQDGSLWEWGFARTSSQNAADLSPQRVDSVGNIAAISAHDYCLLLLRSDGTLWIGGQNASAAAPLSVLPGSPKLVQVGKDNDWKNVYAGACFLFARKRDNSWWVCGYCDASALTTVPPFPWLRLPIITSPRRLPFSFDPWALAPGLGNALLLTKDGTIWTLSVRPDLGNSATRITRLEQWLNNMLAVLPGHPQPFNPKKFRLETKAQKIWHLPVEKPNLAAEGAQSGSN